MKKEQIKNFISNKYFLLTLLSIAGLLIRLICIDKKFGLWNDEILTYTFASKHFPFGIAGVFLKEDYHMPLYYIFLGGWIRIFGTSDVIVRLSAVFWGVLTIPAMFFLGKTYKSNGLGFLMASFCALSPLLIYYSQEVRFYSMLAFFTTLSTAYFIKCLRTSSNKDFALFHIVNLFLLYTYVMGIIFVGLQILFLFIHFFTEKKADFKRFLKSTLIFFVLALPYLILLASFVYEADHMLIEPIAWIPSTEYFFPLLLNDWFSPLMTCYICQDYRLYNILFSSMHGIIYVIVLSSSTICCLIGFGNKIKKLNNEISYLLLTALLFFLYEIYLQGKENFVITTRYTIIILPILFLVALSGILEFKNKWLKTTLITIIIAVLSINVINYKHMHAFMERPGGFAYPSRYLMELKPNNDYLMALERAELFRKYTKGFNFIDFDVPGILYLYKDKTKSFNIFGKELALKTTKHNAMHNLTPFFMNPEPTIYLQEYVNSQAKKIPAGKRLIYIEGPFHGSRKTYDEIFLFVQLYQNHLVPHFQNQLLLNIIEKIDIDTKNALNKCPHLIKTKESEFIQPNYNRIEYIKYKIFVYKRV